MKTKRFYILLALNLAPAATAMAQGTFQDLDFEAANVTGYQPNFPVPTSSALPGWQTSIGTSPTSSVSLDGASESGAEISIFNNNPTYGTTPIEGNYSVILFGGAVLPDSLESASISQTGTVPSGTQSIEFDGNVAGAPFVVTLGGETIDMVPLHSFVNYELWGGNISPAMAGQSETLTFTEPPPAGTPPSEFQLDDIMFSPTSVITTPEPDALTLMSVGGLLFGLYRRFARRRR
jgi:hypothetical protein